ncbi:hypothetical protein Gasu2_25920 [Galdieria sulphuraria]|uniref:Uncharacterized protein n=1 Tax=Galdieria sulphuraria TaxID=130081 RepID=M2XZ28_GALSU|nr:uncharacterized protein Gasu_36320 [Galdieria sulphuraria]EME28893.1 hypothetical protein Gasu_36320 [Galdieria sulphuraria]GJD08282.1 hypothetical protein Gasu2_25920 [Galdieria sulphuraria]|eukprot:XP_005705413.1 hypothetical protein Gasu_36320 [Galdieria sulphuraria]
MSTNSKEKPFKSMQDQPVEQVDGVASEETMTVEQYLLEKCSESVRELQQCAEKLNQELLVDAESCKKKIREIVEQI